MGQTLTTLVATTFVTTCVVVAVLGTRQSHRLCTCWQLYPCMIGSADEQETLAALTLRSWNLAETPRAAFVAATTLFLCTVAVLPGILVVLVSVTAVVWVIVWP